LLCYKKSVRFEWDPEKAKENERKHGVGFDEAATCFEDSNGCYLRNETPSYEDRLILIALSGRRRLLLVIHAEVERDAIRIVSARKASPAIRLQTTTPQMASRSGHSGKCPHAALAKSCVVADPRENRLPYAACGCPS